LLLGIYWCSDEVITRRSDKSIAWALPVWCYLYLLVDSATGTVLAGWAVCGLLVAYA
jgi:hypothetical protein